MLYNYAFISQGKLLSLVMFTDHQEALKKVEGSILIQGHCDWFPTVSVDLYLGREESLIQRSYEKL